LPASPFPAIIVLSHLGYHLSDRPISLSANPTKVPR
jgi:hypothetical protein